MYVIKALVGWVLPPGLFILVVWILAGWLMRTRRRTAGALLALLGLLMYVCSVPLVADAWMRGLEQSTSVPDSPRGDVIVMLGGGATVDTPDEDGVGMLSSAAESRLLTVVRLYRKTHSPIVLSGGQVYPDDGVESDIARRQLLSLGVAEGDIYVENHSRNTHENALFTKPILAKHHFTRPILVTSAYHMQRAMIEFRKAGMNVQPYPCDYQVSTHFIWYPNLLMPSGTAVSETWTVLHEYLGSLQARLSH